MKSRKLKYFVPAVFLSALSGATPSYAQVNAEQVMNIGRNVLSMEDYLLSIQYFNQAIKAKPYLADAYFYRGLAKLSLDDYDGAIADCNLALDRNKFKSEAYKVRGFAYMNIGKDSLAIADFNKGLEYNPDDRYFLFYKGIAQSELKKYESADSTFSYLLRRHPNFEDGYLAAGRMDLQRGDTISALAKVDHALKISKSLLNAYLLKAEIAAGKKEWENSIQNMDEAIRLRPEQPEYYINRAYLRYNNEDFFGAMSDYNYSLQLDPENSVALFNRALLRTEVKELTNADADFTHVLKLDPNNFYALYNRGLVNLELGNYKKALEDFRKIARRYPRFHPAYYAIAECLRHTGDMKGMVDNIKKADNLVAGYVANPTKNPLDRPAISSGSNSSRRNDDTPETDEEFMQRFNQLMTTTADNVQELAFNDRIKGRVQDRNINVTPEGAYFISFIRPETNLRNLSNYFRDLDNLNRRRYISRLLYIRQDTPMPSSTAEMQQTFAIEDDFSRGIVGKDKARPVDMLGRGVARMMLKNYDEAIADLTAAIEGSENFTTALFARSNAYYLRSKAMPDKEGAGSMLTRADLQMAMNDLDTLLKLAPGMVYGWFNKGLLYYEAGDYTSALQCFDEAIRLDPEFGPAYFNRGLAFLQQGNRQKAFSDLSKAGELGVLPSYNILKRMK